MLLRGEVYFIKTQLNDKIIYAYQSLKNGNYLGAEALLKEVVMELNPNTERQVLLGQQERFESYQFSFEDIKI